MRTTLEPEKRVNRSDGRGIAGPDPHLGAARTIESLVADRCAERGHDGAARHGLRVDLERLAEVSPAERGRDVAHVAPDGCNVTRVSRIGTIEDYAPAVGEVFKDVGGRILVHAHDYLAAGLHVGVGCVLLDGVGRSRVPRAAACKEYEWSG